MQSFQEDEKGLFTFYREQADLEQQLKHYKKRIRVQKKDQKGKESKGYSKFDSTIVQDEQNLGQVQVKHKKPAAQDKLLELISKQHTHDYRSKKRQIFMNEYPENKQEDSSILKRKLQKWHQEEEIEVDKIWNENQTFKKLQNQVYGKKQNIVKAYHCLPFQRLSIAPTNFQPQIENNLDKKVSSFNPRKLFSKYSSSNLQVRKNDRILHVSQSFHLKEPKPLPVFPIKESYSHSKDAKKQLFPKIQVKSVSEIINKLHKVERYDQMVDHLNFNSKIIDSLAPQNISKPILTERQKRKKDLSFLLQSVKLQLEDTTKTNRQNKIYALFINSKLQQFQNKEKQEKKDVVFIDILRRMKFT